MEASIAKSSRERSPGSSQKERKKNGGQGISKPYKTAEVLKLQKMTLDY